MPPLKITSTQTHTLTPQDIKEINFLAKYGTYAILGATMPALLVAPPVRSFAKKIATS
jgi:hypothetical protein